jgi:phage shock protein A
MFERFVNVIRSIFGALLGKAEDPALLLEQTYQDLNANVMQVRQAVAQALATEKQIEQQYLKNQEQVKTWHNRAAMAVKEGKDDLAKQALQRKQQYTQVMGEQEILLKNQHQTTESLKIRLAELEEEVQKAYSKKQVLIARDKAAQATSKANELLSKTNAYGTLSVMDRMETKVEEKEARAAALAELSGDNLEKQFKNIETKSDIDGDLAALKDELGMGATRIEIREPVLLEENKKTNQIVESEEISGQD